VSRPAETTTLKQLLLVALASFEELWVLVWFHDRGEGTEENAAHVARATGLPVEAVEMALRSLAARGILSPASSNPRRFALLPSSVQRQALTTIAREYHSDPARVIRLMTANSIERVRASALRTFADCFRVRGPQG
jgi:hypothetical protein